MVRGTGSEEGRGKRGWVVFVGADGVVLMVVGR